MSRLMRRGRRETPSPLNIGRAPAAIMEKVESLSPRRILSPRQFFVTVIPIQATALPSPITTILTTTKYETVTPTSIPTAPSISMASVQTQIPTTAAGINTAPVPTIQADQTAVGGSDAPSTVANVAQGSNMPVIAGVAGAAGFSFLSIALYFYVRSIRVSSTSDSGRRNTLDMRRTQAIAGQLNRPYSSRGRMG